MKVLGVQWCPTEDCLIFDLQTIHEAAAKILEFTKRKIVSLASRVYDPLGVLLPVTTQLKLMCQEVCAAKIAWDDPI